MRSAVKAVPLILMVCEAVIVKLQFRCVTLTIAARVCAVLKSLRAVI